MTSLEVRSFRNEDNSVSMIVLVPPRRNGEPNFGAMARVNHTLLTVNPDAFDPVELPAPDEGVTPPIPPIAERAIADAEAGDDEPGALKAGEANREHG